MNDGQYRMLGTAVAGLATDAVCVVDATTQRVLEVNAGFTRVFGFDLATARDLRLGTFLEEQAALDGLLSALDGSGSANAGILALRCNDGTTTSMVTRAGVSNIDGKRVYCLVMRDLSDIELAHRAARESERRYQTLAEAAFEGIAITEQGRLIDGNEQLGRLLGAPISQLIGTRVSDLVAPESREKLIERFRQGAGELFEHTVLRPDGSRFEAESQARTLTIDDRTLRVTALRDISARKQLEEQLQRSQRLESIGRLAGGIAHDFNNLLTVILSVVDLLLEAEHPQNDQDDLKQVQAAAERAAVLTQQLLAFARRRIVEPKVVDLNSLVTDLDKMLRRLLGEQVALVTACSAGLGAVRVDPGQVEQVVVNLAINARDAMHQGGTLTIETANVELDDVYASTHPEVSPGHYVMLAVSDTGSGIDAETLKHIFEPFFTTKGGRGNGLGLSTCYGIAKQSGGSLWVYSEVDRGTTFKLYLPRVYAALDSLERPKTPPPRQGTERLLLVEDDAMVRPVAARALREHGYEVHAVAKPSEALQLFAQFEGKFDALVTDVVLPEMNGRQLAQLLRERNPGLRVLYTSGYTENTIVHHGVVDAGVHFLAKPYLSSALARRVREVLDGAEASLEP